MAVIAGIALGLTVGVVASRWLGTLLGPGESVRPVTLGMAAAALTISALLATWIPARRASRLAPTAALQRD